MLLKAMMRKIKIVMKIKIRNNMIKNLIMIMRNNNQELMLKSMKKKRFIKEGNIIDKDQKANLSLLREIININKINIKIEIKETTINIEISI